MALSDLLSRHGLSQKAAAAEAGVPLATFSDVVGGRRSPTTHTVNKILAWARRYDSGATYEQLFGDGAAA